MSPLSLIVKSGLYDNSSFTHGTNLREKQAPVEHNRMKCSRFRLNSLPSSDSMMQRSCPIIRARVVDVGTSIQQSLGGLCVSLRARHDQGGKALRHKSDRKTQETKCKNPKPCRSQHQQQLCAQSVPYQRKRLDLSTKISSPSRVPCNKDVIVGTSNMKRRHLHPLMPQAWIGAIFEKQASCRNVSFLHSNKQSTSFSRLIRIRFVPCKKKKKG